MGKNFRRLPCMLHHQHVFLLVLIFEQLKRNREDLPVVFPRTKTYQTSIFVASGSRNNTHSRVLRQTRSRGQLSGQNTNPSCRPTKLDCWINAVVRRHYYSPPGPGNNGTVNFLLLVPACDRSVCHMAKFIYFLRSDGLCYPILQLKVKNQTFMIVLGCKANFFLIILY